MAGIPSIYIRVVYEKFMTWLYHLTSIIIYLYPSVDGIFHGNKAGDSARPLSCVGACGTWTMGG